MNFNEFTQKVIEEIKNYLPEEYADAEVTITRIVKENVEKTGLHIRNNHENVTPSIYLEELYELYEHDHNIEKVLSKIAELRTLNEIQKPVIDYESLMKWEFVKEDIVPAFMNAELNKELLEDLVHKRLGDMAIYYRVIVKINDGLGTVKITHQLLKSYGVTGKQLYKQAIENLDKYTGKAYTVWEMRQGLDIGFEIPGERDFVIIGDSQEPGPAGAANVLNFKLCDKAADILGRDEIILIPSSRHEMLAVPMDMPPIAVAEMIAHTNKYVLEKEDILSYIPYQYSTDTKEVTVYGDWE